VPSGESETRRAATAPDGGDEHEEELTGLNPWDREVMGEPYNLIADQYKKKKKNDTDRYLRWCAETGRDPWPPDDEAAATRDLHFRTYAATLPHLRTDGFVSAWRASWVVLRSGTQLFDATRQALLVQIHNGVIAGRSRDRRTDRPVNRRLWSRIIDRGREVAGPHGMRNWVMARVANSLRAPRATSIMNLCGTGSYSTRDDDSRRTLVAGQLPSASEVSVLFLDSAGPAKGDRLGGRAALRTIEPLEAEDDPLLCPVGPVLQLLAVQGVGGFMFRGDNGGRLRSGTVTARFNEIAARGATRLEVERFETGRDPVTFSSLRKSALAYAMEGGSSLQDATSYIGWASTKTPAEYYLRGHHQRTAQVRQNGGKETARQRELARGIKDKRKHKTSARVIVQAQESDSDE
jgi:hypothetical protein